MVFENNGERPKAAHYSESFYASRFFGNLVLFAVQLVFVARKPSENRPRPIMGQPAHSISGQPEGNQAGAVVG